MRSGILTLLLLAVTISGFSQTSSNYLQLVTGTSWNFACNTAADLETAKTISNAFTIKVRTRAKSCSVYVKLSSYTLPSGAAPSFNPLYIDFNSDTSPNAYNEASSIGLQTYDQLMFNQPKMNATPAYYSFNYNLRLAALGYTDFIPGTYYYTLTFTMTQP